MWIVEELESAIDIVDLVSKYVNLKKAWVNYKSVCPFPWHSEKTPSFIVSKSKQLAYCFGCHKWWWIVKFIMDIENCEFREAIEILWNFSWIKVNTNFNKEKFEEKKSLYSIHKDIVNYYKSAIKNYPEIKKYLIDRWIQQETIQKFHIWYSDNWVELYNYLKNKWYDDKLIEESKVFLNIKQKKDKFIWRIIFPIQNLRWDFVALAWRIVNTWEPKYLNSPANKIYDKSSILYWLYDARNSITKQDYIIITEWYMDTIALQEAWFFNSVAVSGTALTNKHLSIIKRLTHKIYICFDWDKAWEKATKLAIEIMKNKWFEVKIIILPKWKDPDDIIKSWKNFQDFIDNSVTPIWYYIKKWDFNLSSIDDKKKQLIELLNIVKSYSDNIEKDFYLKEISKILDINSKIVYDNFNKIIIKKENKQDKTHYKITNEDLAIWYILSNATEKELQKNTKILEENIIFTKNIGNKFLLLLLNENTKSWQDKILNNLELNLREKYRWVALKIEEENKEKTKEIIEKDIIKIAMWINKELYKNKAKALKDKINLWDTNALKEYSELIKKAKELWIK